MNIRNVLICAALAFAPACSKSPDAMMDKMVGMMEEMGKAVESANGDCGKMASSLEDITKKYEGDIKEMKAMGEKMKGDKAERGAPDEEVRRPHAEGDAGDDGHGEVLGRPEDEGSPEEARRHDVSRPAGLQSGACRA